MKLNEIEYLIDSWFLLLQRKMRVNKMESAIEFMETEKDNLIKIFRESDE